MDTTHNPLLGTRQYPNMGQPPVPGIGYSEGMEPVEIGTLIREAREAKGWSQEDLAVRAGRIGQSTIGRIENGEFKRMPSNLPAICDALDIPLPMTGAVPAVPGIEIPRARVLGDRDFPVHTAAEGGPGEIIVETDPIDFIPRPGNVQYVREAYGLVITGTSMVPEFRPGQIAVINPRLPVMPGEIYIFYAEREGEARATIKELKRISEKEWRVEQHNPPHGKSKELALPRKDWRWAHMVVGKHRA